ncbi:MAG: hypothetical protein JXA09_00045 [Anaerolineae bacterium]|nr:hypothetical protein [Anaerolineae bacterium]
MTSGTEWRWVAIWAAALVALAALPYLIGYLAAPDDLCFTGFVANPADGHSYLTKTNQGFRGEWTWRLTYTPEPHAGAFLFTYHLFLGHVARWVGISPILILNLARTVNGYGLLFALYYALSWIYTDVAQRRFAFLLVALGSGVGWIAALAGGMTVDLWVPEGYVFYSLLANAHFPLAIASMVLILTWSVTPWDARRVRVARLTGIALTSGVLAIVQPFCLVTVGVVLLVYALARWIQVRRLPWVQVAAGAVVGIVALPFAANAYLVTAQNPVLAGWSAQNQTPSPPPWDYAAGYGLLVPLALWGVWRAARRREGRDLLLLSWALSTVVLIYLPISLQRRLVMGLVVPLGALAAMGWDALPQRWRRWRTPAWVAAGLTHVLLLGMAIVSVLGHHSALYIARDEYAAMTWMAEHVDRDALVAAAPETGLYIPAWAGQRVFYGHPFETTQAELREAELDAFLSTGDVTVLPYLPDYVFYGPRERALVAGSWQPDDRWSVAHREGTVTLYAVPRD